jgi:hypothetical protein
VFYFFRKSQPENEKQSVRDVSNGLKVGAHLGYVRTMQRRVSYYQGATGSRVDSFR